jgi:hypothetical protein
MRIRSAAVLVVAAALSACSSYGGTSSSTSAAGTSSAPDLCASADDFRASLSSLADVQVVQEGTDSLQSAWTTVEDDWAGLADGARSRYSDEVDGVQADADAVGSALDSAVQDPSAQALGAAAAAVGVFVQNASALVDEVSSTC